jgi:hypothetical protein
MIKTIGVIAHDRELVQQLSQVLATRFADMDVEILEDAAGEFTVYIDAGPLDEEWREPDHFDFRIVDLNFAHYADVLYTALATTN